MVDPLLQTGYGPAGPTPQPSLGDRYHRLLTGQGWLYLVAFLDLCSRRVVGWAMSPLLDAQLTIAALRMALRQRQPGATLIIHD